MLTPIQGGVAPAELRARRRALGLTQAQLGAELGVAGNTVARWERGDARIGNPALVQLALERLEGVRAGQGIPEAPRDQAKRNIQLRDQVAARGEGSRRRAVARHNLPAERTSLIGRDQDVANIRDALLESEGRLVTLTGTGGAGKTRLALRVGAELVDAFRDGVWLVELASLVDSARMPQAVAAVLGIRERPGTPLVRTMVESLSTCQELLVLDNCEHLADATAALMDALLPGCPELRILTTSREPLRVIGEVVWRVPPLTVPDVQRFQALDDLSACPAVQLFADRARAVRRDFSLTASNADTIAQICTLLAGLPLAEELAAARVRVLGVQQIRERLGESLLLTDETRYGEERHRTLQATLDWSHALLSEPEQTLFRRLAVFAGGWTLEAAEAVCIGEDVRSSDVLHLLTRLVDRSLVVSDEDGERVRFRLLEPIREYAQRLLLASGEAEALAQSHARYFRDLAKRLDSQRLGWHTRILDHQRQAELANFRVAMGWAVASGEAEVGLRLAAALRTFWSARGLLTEAREWFARLLNLPRGMGGTRSRARALCVAGYAAYYQGDHSAAVHLLTESVALWRELEDPAGLADALDELGLVGWARADFGLAREVLGEALGLARALGLRQLEGRCAYHLGLVMYEQGDFVAAKEWHTQSLAVAHELHDPLAEARAFYGLGQLAYRRGDLALARSLHERGLARRREVGEPWGMALALVGLGQVSIDEGDLSRAGELFAQSLSLSRELGDRHGLARSLEGLAAVSSAHGQYERALRLAAAAATLRDMGAAPLSPTEAALLERRLAAARNALGHHSRAALATEASGWSIDDAIALALSGADDGSPGRTGDPLTARQQEVAVLVGQGLTNRQIAERLVITERAAAAHVEHILDKLGVGSRAQIAAWAAERGLLATRPG